MRMGRWKLTEMILRKLGDLRANAMYTVFMPSWYISEIWYVYLPSLVSFNLFVNTCSLIFSLVDIT